MNKIHSNVILGENVEVGDFCIIGEKSRLQERLETRIGKDSIIRSHTIIYEGNIIGHNFETGNKVNIREQNEIGNYVSIGALSVIEHNVKIEDKVRIHTQVFIPEYCTLEEESWIGPNVVLTNCKYPKSRKSKEYLSGVEIGKGSIIGANSTIMPGIRIGNYSIVGAGSLVTKDIKPYTVVFGVPAKTIKRRGDIEYPNGEKAYK